LDLPPRKPSKLGGRSQEKKAEDKAYQHDEGCAASDQNIPSPALFKAGTRRGGILFLKRPIRYAPYSQHSRNTAAEITGYTAKEP